MIVLGADMHKQTHTSRRSRRGRASCAARRPSRSAMRGFLALLDWARGLGAERVWALEDCRHVSGSLERFLISSGERVVRVATKLMNDARRAGRERGKSDRIDALAVARAALREGIEALPSAQLAGRRARDPAARRSPRAADPQPRRAQQRPALAPARPLARAQVARQRAVLKEVVDRGSRGAWPAPSRPHGSGSPATSCGGCASSPSPPTRSRPRSPTSSTRPRRSCSQSPASGP